MAKIVLLTLAVLLAAALAGFAAWFHAGVPPNCTDPRTLALVRETFPRHHLPPTTQLTAIRTVAGGALALRFVCQAMLTGFARNDLPPDSPVPGEITYTSRLTDNRTRHEVTVQIEPLLRWEKAP